MVIAPDGHLRQPHLPHAITIMRRTVLRRAGAGTRVYRGLQPGQGQLRRAGDAGESRGGDDAQGYGYGKSAGLLKNIKIWSPQAFSSGRTKTSTRPVITSSTR